MRLFLAMVAGAALAAQAAGQTKAWTPPRTPDGQPDFQGVWTNATITPFERPPELAGKAFLTDQEAAELEKKAAGNRVDRAPAPGDVGNYNQAWFDSGSKVVSTKQTSLVVVPANGRVPVKPAAEAKRDYDLAHVADSYEYMSVWDRCITRGVPAGMFPAGYNNAYQIMQTRDKFVLLYEMIHEARVIPLDGRPHAGAGVRSYLGDSRGHWEGNTLVIETTNFNGKAGIPGNPVLASTELKIVERLTRVEPELLRYEATVIDPRTYTKPFTIAVPFTSPPGYQVLPYECHEGNLALHNILSAARSEERAAADALKKGLPPPPPSVWLGGVAAAPAGAAR